MKRSSARVRATVDTATLRRAMTVAGPKPYDVTAPLALRWRAPGRRPDGRPTASPDGNPEGIGAKVIAACFPHSEGLLYLDLFWHQSAPQQAAHLLRGELTGNGPWRIGDWVISVLGCHSTDADLADDFARWRDYLASNAAAAEYPPPAQIRDIARRLGASV